MGDIDCNVNIKHHHFYYYQTDMMMMWCVKLKSKYTTQTHWKMDGYYMMIMIMMVKIKR